MGNASLSVLLCALMLSVFFSGCCCIASREGGPLLPGIPGDGGRAKWTVIALEDGDNNIEEPIVLDVMEMESAGSTSDVNIIVQLDRSSQYFAGQGDWSGARRYRLVRGDGQTLSSPVLVNLGDSDSGNPQTLVDFASWAVDNYPADRYLLILSDHGGGWTGMFQDETSDSGMDLAEMRRALSAIRDKLGRKIDVVVFDMCLMSQYDVMLDVEPYADYMVASEEVVPGYSFPYDHVMGEITGNPGMQPRELSAMMVREFAEYYLQKEDATTMTASDMSKIPALKAAFNAFARKLKPLADDDWSRVADLHLFAEYYALGTPDARVFSFADLDDFASNVQAYAGDDAELNASAAAVRSAVRDAVVANYRHPKHPRSAGISYFFQPSNGIYERVNAEQYPLTTAYGEEDWRQFLRAYYAKAEMPLTSPSVTGFQVSPYASLVRPLNFTVSLDGNNIVSSQGYEFRSEGGEWLLARAIGQRGTTTLPDGKQVYGYPGGSSQATGFSTPMEFTVGDGSRHSFATVIQMWPSQDVLAVQGTLAKAAGGECDAVVYFPGSGGAATYALCSSESPGGGSYVAMVPLGEGDVFTPSVFKLGYGNLTESRGQPVTYGAGDGFFLEWHPLEEGRRYLSAVEIQDVQQQTASQSAEFAASKAPPLNPLSQGELAGNWECGQLAYGLQVDRVMTLNLSGNGGCNFTDAGGASPCAFTYSEAGSPHAYLYLEERRESMKFFVSRRSADAFWVFDLAGSTPIYCQRGGSGRPTIEVYRELYNSVGDAGNDLDELQNDSSKLVGEWSDPASGTTMSFTAGGAFTWTTRGNSVSGTYTVEGEQIFLTASGQNGSTSAYFLLGKKKLALQFEPGREMLLYKPGQAPSASPTPQPQQTPTPQPAQRAVAGNWFNPAAGVMLMLGYDGSYMWVDPLYYEYGTYGVSGNVITFNSMGFSAQYYYALSGNTLTVYNAQKTVTLQKAS